MTGRVDGNIGDMGPGAGAAKLGEVVGPDRAGVGGLSRPGREGLIEAMGEHQRRVLGVQGSESARRSKRAFPDLHTSSMTNHLNNRFVERTQEVGGSRASDGNSAESGTVEEVADESNEVKAIETEQGGLLSSFLNKFRGRG